MITVRLLDSVKMDDPYVIVGDKNAKVELSESAAKWAVIQKLAEYNDPNFMPSRVNSLGLLPHLPESGQESEPSSQSDDSPVRRALDNVLEPTDELKRPYGNAPKDAWIEYACAVDPELSVDRAKGMTKNDLMARYGERL